MQNILKILKIARPLYSLISVIAGLILVGALLDLVTPILSKFIVDEVVKNVQNKTGNYNTLVVFLALSFAATVLSTIIGSITERLGDHFAGKLRKFLTEKFYRKVLTLSQSYFDSELSGKIVNQLNRGIQSIQGFINTSTNFILPTFLQSIFTIVVLAYYNVPVALLTFALFPIYLYLSHKSTTIWGKEELAKNKLEDTNRGRIQEVIGNIKVVKSFNNEKTEYGIVENNMSEVNKIYARQSNTFHVFDFLRNMSLNIILLIINIIVFVSTFRGTLTIGELVLILQLINQARRPLFAMSFILTQVQTAESGSKEFFEILELESTEEFDQNKKIEKINLPTIEFKKINFKYDKSEIVLKDASFKINEKEKIALVGHSGAGKSTIVNLILKFYNPTEGEILLKGKNYTEFNYQTIRNNIALVFQENELFSSNIRENVSYGGQASEAEIIEALKMANAYDFVSKLPQGLDSEIGERGVRLSGGQKQRIQIARAILKNSPILILDEATSSLDAKSEKEVQEALENMMKDKLVLIIAHRFSTIQNVDKVIVLDHGSIADYGKPGELAQKPGLYSELLRYQIEGNKKLLENYEIY
ncbi:MAG: ABC transporter ATP-binding protein/permease [bacterium]|nr:ABC transporter ATP-binding protein/permease [bacterium]